MSDKKPNEIMQEFLRATKDERAAWRKNAEEKLLKDILSDVWHDERDIPRGSPLNQWQDKHLEDFQAKNMARARWALNSFNTLISPITKAKDYEERRNKRRDYIYLRVCQSLYGQNVPSIKAIQPKQSKQPPRINGA